MSEPPHQLPIHWNNWLNVDLLDACYDPMHDSIGLDSGVRVLKPAPQPWIETKSPLHHEYPRTEQVPNSASDYVVATESDNFEQWLEPTMATTDTSVTPKNAAEESTKKVYICLACNKSCRDNWELEWHVDHYKHLGLPCRVAGCEQKFVSRDERKAHERRPHTTGHGRVATNTPFECVQCKESFRLKSDLLRHSKEQQHQPYACECGASFSRLDVLNRHLESFSTKEPEYPCKYCRRHRGADGFRRKDHLIQHMRNYHHHEIGINTDTDADVGAATGTSSRLKYSFPVCSHPECPQYRTEGFKKLPRRVQEQDKPFASQSAYTKHMREEHDECAFPCDIAGCTRIGRRGYFREKDLIRHRNEQHPDASDYRVSVRQLRHMCTEPGCGAVLDFSSLTGHYELHTVKRNEADRIAEGW